MKKALYIFLLSLALTGCSVPHRVYRGEVQNLYYVTTFFGDRYYLVEIKDANGRNRKMRVQYGDWIKLKADQEVVLF